MPTHSYTKAPIKLDCHKNASQLLGKWRNFRHQYVGSAKPFVWQTAWKLVICPPENKNFKWVMHCIEYIDSFTHDVKSRFLGLLNNLKWPGIHITLSSKGWVPSQTKTLGFSKLIFSNYCYSWQFVWYSSKDAGLGAERSGFGSPLGTEATVWLWASSFLSTLDWEIQNYPRIRQRQTTSAILPRSSS